MKRLLLLSALILSACTGPGEKAVNPDPNHTHADFAIWTNGEQVDFADEKYMSGYEDDHEHEHGHLHDYYHLHDGIGHVIHRHKPGLHLDEFFSSLGITLGPECVTMSLGAEYCNTAEKRWMMAVNGEIRPLDLSYVFEDTDTILLTYGSNAEQIQQQIEKLTDDACLYSRTCPERGDPPEENCIADPAVPCVAPLED
jgi:hypothetical protein